MVDRTPPSPPGSLSARLLALGEEAVDAGDFETSYHALMAALHAAERARDLDAVRRVGEAAAAHEARLEAIVPAHPLSAAWAARRGTRPVHRTLRVHVDSVRLRLESHAAPDRGQRRPPD